MSVKYPLLLACLIERVCSEIPAELRQQGGGSMVHVDLEDHRHEEYKRSVPKVKAFAGQGHMLGRLFLFIYFFLLRMNLFLIVFHSPTPNVTGGGGNQPTAVTSVAASAVAASTNTSEAENK